jgi:hypothetical protein
MKAHVRVIFTTGVVCFVLGAGAVWVGRLTANAANPQTPAPAVAAAPAEEPDSMSEKNDAHNLILRR